MKILALSLTPALQRTMIFEKLEPGAVNRAKEVIYSASGKGTNVAMALASLGHEALASGFAGGTNLKAIEADITKRGAIPFFTKIKGNVRICDTLISGGVITELVEEAPPVTAADFERFKRQNLRALAECDAMAISGNLPASVSQGGMAYVPFAKRASEIGIPWVIDSHGAPLLNVLPFRPLVAKMNRFELEATKKSAAELIDLGAQWVFITDGGNPALLMNSKHKTWELPPPKLKEVVNPIGSGDCTTAGLLHSILGGATIPAAARFAQKCGSANAQTLIPGLMK